MLRKRAGMLVKRWWVTLASASVASVHFAEPQQQGWLLAVVDITPLGACGKLVRCTTGQAAVRPHIVVVDTPRFNCSLRNRKRESQHSQAPLHRGQRIRRLPIVATTPVANRRKDVGSGIVEGAIGLPLTRNAPAVNPGRKSHVVPKLNPKPSPASPVLFKLKLNSELSLVDATTQYWRPGVSVG